MSEDASSPQLPFRVTIGDAPHAAPPALARLHRAAFAAADAGGAPWSADSFETLAAAADAVWAEAWPVAFSSGSDAAAAPIGLAFARRVDAEAELLTLCRAPARRGQGLGRALLSAVEKTLATAGARRLILEVSEQADPARALYAASGFEMVGLRRGYYQAPGGGRCNALILEKWL